MSIGINESADESDLECLSRPGTVSTGAVPSETILPLTKNHFAAVQDTDDLVPRGTVGLDLE